MARERIATWPSGRASRWSVATAETLTGNRVITVAEIETYNAMAFDPGGSARNVDLPPASACKGVYLFISNTADGAEDLTIRDAIGATIVTPGQDEAAMVWCDGVRWYGMVGDQS